MRWMNFDQKDDPRQDEERGQQCAFPLQPIEIQDHWQHRILHKHHDVIDGLLRKSSIRVEAHAGTLGSLLKERLACQCRSPCTGLASENDGRSLCLLYLPIHQLEQHLRK